jgi:6-phosphogluconate dehydrogenase
LHDIRDAVVQDANDSEGTGVWANIEAMRAHVPTPSLSAAHYLRLASSDGLLRESIKTSLSTVLPAHVDMGVDQKAVFLEDLRKAVYCAILACYVQGLDLLARVNAREGWGINLQEVLRI